MLKKINLNLLLLGIIIAITGVFLLYSYKNFKLEQNFEPLPLSFNPSDSSSTYNWQGATVKIKGGFVKGKIKKGNSEELLLRALSPDPEVDVKGEAAKNFTMRLENVNPAKIKIINSKQKFTITDIHTVSLNVRVGKKEEKSFKFAPQDEKEYPEFVILGDNRNGYQTFSQIIDQINAINPVFAIDNGDLVFGGEANKYRLFNETVSKLQVPLYTTLGNHDIREGGRPIYTKLYGPPYYSFDYKNIHFTFLDSSRGWAEKKAIPEEQYRWLEEDLKKAQGKRIFVISHIPPTDPRSRKEPNKYPNIPGVQKADWFEREMNNYYQWKNIDHSFPDKEEAKRFEKLMTEYNVDTVFLSHIHSYFSFVKNNVRYIISGGGGAELLTEDSYYHFMRVKVTDKENYLEVVQLPSPANNFQDRLLAAIQLFAASVYREYFTYVIIIGAVIVLILLWIIWNTRHHWWPKLKFLGRWVYETVKFARGKYKEMKNTDK